MVLSIILLATGLFSSSQTLYFLYCYNSYQITFFGVTTDLAFSFVYVDLVNLVPVSCELGTRVTTFASEFQKSGEGSEGN